MDILIGIGVAAMFAAVCVIYYKWNEEKEARRKLSILCKAWEENCNYAHEDNLRLRNDLHAAINARKAKSRGITGKQRKAIETHKADTIALGDAYDISDIDRALWSVLDSEAV